MLLTHFSQKKPPQSVVYNFSGDGGNRTRVRKPVITDFYILSLLQNFAPDATTDKSIQALS